MRDLILVAHFREAEAFLSLCDHQWRDCGLKGVSFWETQQGWDLLQVGEGPLGALGASLVFLTQFKDRYCRIWNAGICGALISSLKTGTIVQIGECYLHLGQKSLAFETWDSAQDPLPQIPVVSCVSSWERVLNPNLKEFLSSWADIVDREAFWLAQACRFWKLPFYSLKIVVDEAQSPTDCDWVRDVGPQWMLELAKALLPLISQNQGSEMHQPSQVFAHPFEDKSFHWTVALKNEFLRFWSQISEEQKNQILQWAEELKKRPMLPKKRSLFLLEKIKQTLWNNYQIEHPDIAGLKRELEENGVNVRWLPAKEVFEIYFHWSPWSERSRQEVLKKTHSWLQWLERSKTKGSP